MEDVQVKDQNHNVYTNPFPCCVWDEVCKSYKKINHVTKKNAKFGKLFKRSWEMAEPIHRRQKFTPQIFKKFGRTIEIVRPYERTSTRLEQLAIPNLRRLLGVKTQFFKYFNKTHKQHVNLLMYKKCISLYSRLANVRPPKPKRKIYKFTKKDWAYMNRRLKKLAAPKKVKKPEKIKKSKKINLEDLTRLHELALPRIRKEEEEKKWVFKASMRNKASDRIREMAVPVVREDHNFKNYMEINPAALKYKATDRLKDLAQPKIKYKEKSDIKINSFEVSPNALKYKATYRILELAEPKEYPEEPSADVKVSPAALKYKPTARIMQLAQPKAKFD